VIYLQVMKKREYHGMNGSAEHNIWLGMRNRCENPNNHRFSLYGGRGVYVCARWQQFSAFYADMGPRPSRMHSLDRINNSGPYAPENCRWALQSTQCRNRRTTRHLTYMGVTESLSWWAEQSGLRNRTLRQRLNAGMSPGRALWPAHPRTGRWLSFERSARE
jgi:hypothetical protein